MSEQIKYTKRPLKVAYPYMCPFCDELAYPSTDSSKRPLREPDYSIYIYTCESGHDFYVCERVVKDQPWAEKRYTSDKWKKQSVEWKRQLRKQNYGVETTEE